MTRRAISKARSRAASSPFTSPRPATSPRRWPRLEFRRVLVALMPVADALPAVLAGVEALPEEMVALDAAHHRVLARDLPALRTQPPRAMSAMDGYAVRAADASKVGARLKVI